jgi:hypothetical protein
MNRGKADDGHNKQQGLSGEEKLHCVVVFVVVEFGAVVAVAVVVDVDDLKCSIVVL